MSNRRNEILKEIKSIHSKAENCVTHAICDCFLYRMLTLELMLDYFVELVESVVEESKKDGLEDIVENMNKAKQLLNNGKGDQENDEAKKER